MKFILVICTLLSFSLFAAGSSFVKVKDAELEYERTMEIKHWLKDHPEVTHWVAVDDLNMGEELTNFILTPNDYQGIKQSGVKDKILKFLK